MSAILLVAPGVATAEQPVDPRSVVASAARPTSALVPLEPCRLLDTRAISAPIPAGGRQHVPVVERCRVPVGSVAVAVTLTAVDPSGDGWLSVVPSDAGAAATSTLNVRAGDTRANGALVALGPDGALSLVSSTTSHVLVDVTAAFVPAAAPTAGRLVTVSPVRVLDTRPGGRPPPGASVVVPLPAGVPADATALAVNITTADSTGPGFFTVHAVGRARPHASVLNTDGSGQTRAASALVPVSSEGFVVHTSAGDHVIVDVSGYFTGDSAEPTSDGTFVPIPPTRLADTRGDGPKLYRDGTREWSLGGFDAGRIAAVALNVTMVEADVAGWVVAHAARTDPGAVSSVNAERDGTVANLALVPASTTGVAVGSSDGTHLVVDVTGWFVGAPRAGDGPAPTNVPVGPGPTLLVGDSMSAALRWYPTSLGWLSGFPYLLDVESCRRTVTPSCRGREGRVPTTALVAVRDVPRLVETVVVMTGYNDLGIDPAGAIDQVVAAARARGARQVRWLTLRVDHAYRIPGTSGSGSTLHAEFNAHLRAATARHPDLRLLDWATYSTADPGWFFADGLHLTPAGAEALARYLADRLHDLGD